MVKKSWQMIAVELSQYDEPTLDRMLNDEITTHKRPAIAKRLHQRLCKLRNLRDRADMMERIAQ
jgi:hypothetical protein